MTMKMDGSALRAARLRVVRLGCAGVWLLSGTAGFAAAADMVQGELPTMRKMRAQDSADAGYAATQTRTGTKTDTALRDVPQAITVITGDLIKDQGMRSMGDVVRYVPGVSMGQGEGHRDVPTLRGNASTADFFIDGVRDDVQYFRDLYNTERIEVLMGSNAMIFGRGGGVIHRVTEQAEWTTHREVTLPSFTRVDAAVFLTLNEHLQAQLNLENLLDETYWGTAHNDNNITPGSPRAARVSLTASF